MVEMFHVDASDCRVDAWAARRLPFEPDGWMADYRAALRAAVGRLEPSDGRLYGAYSSPDQSRCDVENVLLYNVGLSSFSRSVNKAIVVERFFDMPPDDQDERSGFLHHHQYRCDREVPFLDWITVASWPEAPIMLPLRIEQVWAALRNSVVVLDGRDHTRDRLSIEMVVHRPATPSPPTLLSMLKVLIDGAISTLHGHDGTDLAEVAGRVAARLGSGPAGVATMMMDPKTAVLGTRRLLWPFRSFVQWNPADDQLVRVSLESQSASTWSVSGRIRGVAPDKDARLRSTD